MLLQKYHIYDPVTITMLKCTQFLELFTRGTIIMAFFRLIRKVEMICFYLTVTYTHTVEPPCATTSRKRPLSLCILGGRLREVRLFYPKRKIFFSICLTVAQDKRNLHFDFKAPHYLIPWNWQQQQKKIAKAKSAWESLDTKLTGYSQFYTPHLIDYLPPRIQDGLMEELLTEY